MVPDRLAVVEIEYGTTLFRSHHADADILHFGKNQRNRFDDSKGQFSVCYLSLSPAGAFVESLIRKPQGQLLESRDLRSFHLAKLRNQQPLNLVQCYGEGLYRNGLDARISSSTDYQHCRDLSRQLSAHADRPDGLIYRARHDDDQFSIALFERARKKIDEPESSIAWIHTGTIRDDILDRYAIALVDSG